MNNKTRKWIRGGIETLIHGGTAALISSISASMVDADHWKLFSPAFCKLAGASFIGNGGLRFLQWWNNNPLPPEGDTTPPIPGLPPAPVISLNPLSQVVPKQQSTETKA